MRLISCALTQPQIRNRTKTEPRRLGWGRVKVGDRLCFADKCMVFKHGEKPNRIADVVVTGVDRQCLGCIKQDEVVREGFPEMRPRDFVAMFCKNMKCNEFAWVTVIRFKFIPGGQYHAVM